MGKEEDRPPIPTELRRLVLVQAGHRCAIHTCRHPDIEVHHIVPWARCREHLFENLIALCPNCHRRADAGEIDRKSLQMYKARLNAAFHFGEAHAYPFEPQVTPRFGWVDAAARWRTLVLRDSDATRHFDAELEYPEFSPSLRGAQDLNLLVERTVRSLLTDFRETAVYSPDFFFNTAGFHLDCSFGVSLLTDQLASLRLAPHTYAGGAHGNTWTLALNCSLDPFAELRLPDIFADIEGGLEVLSDYCIRQLISPTTDHRSRDEDHVRRGASPKADNFRTVNLFVGGLLVTFDSYSVASYAEGPSEVLVPYSVLREVLSPSLRRVL
jgi:hypothetical protein